MYYDNLQIKESQDKRIFCPCCMAIKNRSKRFTSTKALCWHIGHLHKIDSKYVLDMPITEVQEIVAHVAKAFELGILRP